MEPCGLIFARSLSGGPAYTIAPRRDQIYGDVCADDRLALAGRHLFWVSTFGAHTTHRRLDNALIGAATSQILADHETDCSGGSFVDNTAGDAGTFAYTWGTYAIDCDNGDEIGRETAHLSVFRNGRLTQFRLRSLPGFIAVAAGHVATGEARETAVPRVFETEIVVYTPVGRVVRRLKESGSPRGFGMSARWIATVMSSGRARQLRVFDARSGAIAATAELPTRSSRFQVAVSGTHAVVATGRTVWTLDIARKSLTLLRERPYIVRGLSIEGRRVAWGERVGTRGRVVSALLG